MASLREKLVEGLTPLSNQETAEDYASRIDDYARYFGLAPTVTTYEGTLFINYLSGRAVSTWVVSRKGLEIHHNGIGQFAFLAGELQTPDTVALELTARSKNIVPFPGDLIMQTQTGYVSLGIQQFRELGGISPCVHIFNTFQADIRRQ